MKTVQQQSIIYSILAATIVCTLFLGFNYLHAQWNAPGSTPPNGNVFAPIHTGGGEQLKSNGSIPSSIDRIITGQFLASDRMRSDLYCDASGGNCFQPNEVGTGGGTGGGGGVASGVNVYLCPELPTTAQGNGCTSQCNGQISTQATCDYQTETATDCSNNTASCSSLGELMVSP